VGASEAGKVAGREAVVRGKVEGGKVAAWKGRAMALQAGVVAAARLEVLTAEEESAVAASREDWMAVVEQLHRSRAHRPRRGCSCCICLKCLQRKPKMRKRLCCPPLSKLGHWGTCSLRPTCRHRQRHDPLYLQCREGIAAGEQATARSVEASVAECLAGAGMAHAQVGKVVTKAGKALPAEALAAEETGRASPAVERPGAVPAATEAPQGEISVAYAGGWEAVFVVAHSVASEVREG